MRYGILQTSCIYRTNKSKTKKGTLNKWLDFRSLSNKLLVNDLKKIIFNQKLYIPLFLSPA